MKIRVEIVLAAFLGIVAVRLLMLPAYPSYGVASALLLGIALVLSVHTYRETHSQPKANQEPMLWRVREVATPEDLRLRQRPADQHDPATDLILPKSS